MFSSLIRLNSVWAASLGSSFAAFIITCSPALTFYGWLLSKSRRVSDLFADRSKSLFTSNAFHKRSQTITQIFSNLIVCIIAVFLAIHDDAHILIFQRELVVSLISLHCFFLPVFNVVFISSTFMVTDFFCHWAIKCDSMPIKNEHTTISIWFYSSFCDC